MQPHYMMTTTHHPTADDELVPLRIGDHIYLRDSRPTETGTHGVVVGDSAFFRLGVSQSTSKHEALEFDDCIFRICPMLRCDYTTVHKQIFTPNKTN